MPPIGLCDLPFFTDRTLTIFGVTGNFTEKKFCSSRGLNRRPSDCQINCLIDCATATIYNNGLIDWLIIYGFTSRSRIFHLYGDVTIAGEGLQNLGLCSALRAFEQGGIFIVPHLLWHGTSVFPVFIRRTAPIQSPLTTHEGMWRIYSNPDPHGVI
jgi:hypothetical protein